MVFTTCSRNSFICVFLVTMTKVVRIFDRPKQRTSQELSVLHSSSGLHLDSSSNPTVVNQPIMTAKCWDANFNQIIFLCYKSRPMKSRLSKSHSPAKSQEIIVICIGPHCARACTRIQPPLHLLKMDQITSKRAPNCIQFFARRLWLKSPPPPHMPKSVIILFKIGLKLSMLV